MVATEASHIEKLDKLCPICGYEMEESPCCFNICPSCGTEFGMHDVNATVSELREAWLGTGPQWASKTEPEPENWDPLLQLRRVLGQGERFDESSGSGALVIAASGNIVTSSNTPVRVRTGSVTSKPDWAKAVEQLASS
jgi:hypothetical protein